MSRPASCSQLQPIAAYHGLLLHVSAYWGEVTILQRTASTLNVEASRSLEPYVSSGKWMSRAVRGFEPSPMRPYPAGGTLAPILITTLPTLSTCRFAERGGEGVSGRGGRVSDTARQAKGNRH